MSFSKIALVAAGLLVGSTIHVMAEERYKRVVGIGGVTTHYIGGRSQEDVLEYIEDAGQAVAMIKARFPSLEDVIFEIGNGRLKLVPQVGQHISSEQMKYAEQVFGEKRVYVTQILGMNSRNYVIQRSKAIIKQTGGRSRYRALREVEVEKSQIKNGQ